jgi:hypothetical protein
MLLDAAKSGLRVKGDVLSQDKRDYSRRRPDCMKKKDDDDRLPLVRDPDLPTFVLDVLVKAGEEEQERHLIEFDKLEVGDSIDQALLEPYERVVRKASNVPILSSELEAIKDHVFRLYDPWKNVCGLLREASQSGPGWRRSTRDRNQLSNLVKQFADEVPGICVLPNADEIKASFAYKVSLKFGFSMAYQELCAIKARSEVQGPITQSLLETMKIPSSSLRALAANVEF